MIRYVVLLTLLLVVMNGQAQERFSMNGFIAQGVQRASNTNFVNNDGDVSFNLTEIGLNGRYFINDRLTANGQVVYLNADQRYPEGFRVDYLFLDWHWIRQQDFNVNLHIGRYKNYHWLYSATRDVPHTRPTNLLPQSVYFDSFRDVALGSDGIALRMNRSTEYGEWEANWSYGRSPIDADSTRQLLGQMATGDIEQDFVHQASVYWRSYDSGLLLGANVLDSDFVYNQGISDPFIDGGANVRRVSFVAQYQTQFWEFTSEVMRESSRYDGALFNGFFSDSIAEGGYLQAAYMPTSKLSAIISIDIYDLNREDRSGRELELFSGGAIPARFGYMDTVTTGLRYALQDNVKVHFEYSRVKGAGRLTPLLVRSPAAAPEEYWDMWSVQLMYWF